MLLFVVKGYLITRFICARKLCRSTCEHSDFWVRMRLFIVKSHLFARCCFSRVMSRCANLTRAIIFVRMCLFVISICIRSGVCSHPPQLPAGCTLLVILMRVRSFVPYESVSMRVRACIRRRAGQVCDGVFKGSTHINFKMQMRCG